MDRRRVQSVTGRPWSRVMVSKILTRPRNAGLVEDHGEIVARGTFDAILNEDTWQALRDALAGRSGLVTARCSRRQHLLSGLIYWGICGSRMKVSARRDAEGAVRADSFVSCVKDNGGCGHVKRNLRLAEAFILGAVERRLADASAFADPDGDSEAAQEAARLTASGRRCGPRWSGCRRSCWMTRTSPPRTTCRWSASCGTGAARWRRSWPTWSCPPAGTPSGRTRWLTGRPAGSMSAGRRW